MYNPLYGMHIHDYVTYEVFVNVFSLNIYYQILVLKQQILTVSNLYDSSLG